MSDKGTKNVFKTTEGDSAAVALDLLSEQKHSEKEILSMCKNVFFLECEQIMGKIFTSDSEDDNLEALLLLFLRDKI